MDKAYDIGNDVHIPVSRAPFDLHWGGTLPSEPELGMACSFRSCVDPEESLLVNSDGEAQVFTVMTRFSWGRFSDRFSDSPVSPVIVYADAMRTSDLMAIRELKEKYSWAPNQGKI